jgi:hypothetical protein
MTKVFITGIAGLLGSTFARYLINQGGGLVVAQIPDPYIVAQYLLTLRVTSAVRTFSQVPIMSALPVMNSLRAAGKLTILKKEFTYRTIFSLLLLVFGLAVIYFLFNVLPGIFKFRHYLINGWLYFLLSLSLLLEMHHSCHAQLYITKNHVPFLVPSVFSGITISLLSFLLLPNWGVTAMIISQILVQMAFNNWYPVYLNLKALDWRFSEYIKSFEELWPMHFKLK